MSRPAVVTGAQRRRYEQRARFLDTKNPYVATVTAINRAAVEAGARNVEIAWEGANVVLVTARTPDGGITGGRAAVPEHANVAIAVMYAGAACIRGLIESRAA